MKKIITILASAFIVLNATAQTIKPCGSHEYLQHLDIQQPGFYAQVKKLGELSAKKLRGPIVYVPVVVHIVYKNSTENLSDNYVTSQIEMLNRCYGRRNADTVSLRSEFFPIVGPAKIQFYVKEIKRVSTTKTSFVFEFNQFTGDNMADDVKHTSAGGSDAVTPQSVLNIWVCDIGLPAGQGELLGYAYPPPGLPNWWAGSSYKSVDIDGVVIDYLAFGGTPQKPIGFTSGLQGKTAVHEVGHYLGLRHIWGDDDGACNGQAGFEDDGVADTPECGDASNFNCNKNTNSCITSNDFKDMVENYMDYSSEACENSFTKGQVTLMENVLYTIRTGIHAPTGIDDENIDQLLAIYPNPTRDLIHVSFPNTDTKQLNIVITDILGKKMYSNSLGAIPFVEEVISVSSWNQGVYLLTISDETSVLHRTKFQIIK
ncbi:MAG: zinc-dependent metalloprotease [Chitinophagaceae bacterium]